MVDLASSNLIWRSFLNYPEPTLDNGVSTNFIKYNFSKFSNKKSLSMAYLLFSFSGGVDCYGYSS